MVIAKRSGLLSLLTLALYFALPLNTSYAQQLSVAKSFSANYISPYKTSTLTIVLTNTASTAATLTKDFRDIMPPHLIIVGEATASSACSGTAITSTTASITLPVGAIIAASGVCTISATVTSSNVGVYLNVTSDLVATISTGSVKAPGAQATLVVNMPSLTKCYFPEEISTEEESTLTITLTNPLLEAAVLTEPLVDELDHDIDICDDVINTCGGCVNIEGSRIILSDATIPALGSCFVQVQVRSKCPGHYENCLAEGALQTDQGFNEEPASASLSVCHEHCNS